MLATWKCAPALAAGNTVILKPAEWSPVTASLLADLVDEAGFPPGVFNVVQGLGEEAGASLVADPRVRRVSFTGSPEAARQIGAAAARNIVPFTAELGGKSPFIVFADADLDAAARKAAGQYDDAGQVCLAGTRLLVEESVREAFLERLLACTGEHVAGDSRDPGTTLSPLIHPEHLARVEGFVERGESGGRPGAPGRARHQGGRALVRADPDRAPQQRGRDRATRGVRPSADPPDLYGRGPGSGARQRHALRAGRDRLHRRRGAGRAHRPAGARGHGLGQLLPRPRPERALRRLRHPAASAGRAAITPSTSTAI